MELLQHKYFCDAAETEKFSRTAEKFLVPISNISQSVKRLEKELESVEQEMSGDAAYDYVRLSELDTRKNEIEERLLEIYEICRIIRR